MALQVDQVAHVLDRVVCDSADVPADAYVCKAGRYDRVEGQAPTGIADADQAFDNTGATATWFATPLGVDLTDLIGYDRGDGRKLRSTTRYCPASGVSLRQRRRGPATRWSTARATPSPTTSSPTSWATASPSRPPGLIYWFQSGAINESMSDVIGELVDLTDGTGNDTDPTRWQLGEDLPPRAGGIARDMSDPTAYGQPDHTASHLYDPAFDYADNGGVHTNSGVANKTAYLIVDGTAAEPGGTFNGQSFAGIGPRQDRRPLLDRDAHADPRLGLRRPRGGPHPVLCQPGRGRGRGHLRRGLRNCAGGHHGHRTHPVGGAVGAAQRHLRGRRALGAADLGPPRRHRGPRR